MPCPGEGGGGGGMEWKSRGTGNCCLQHAHRCASLYGDDSAPRLSVMIMRNDGVLLAIRKLIKYQLPTRDLSARFSILLIANASHTRAQRENKYYKPLTGFPIKPTVQQFDIITGAAIICAMICKLPLQPAF